MIIFSGFSVKNWSNIGGQTPKKRVGGGTTSIFRYYHDSQIGVGRPEGIESLGFSLMREKEKKKHNSSDLNDQVSFFFFFFLFFFNISVKLMDGGGKKEKINERAPASDFLLA